MVEGYTNPNCSIIEENEMPRKFIVCFIVPLLMWVMLFSLRTDLSGQYLLSPPAIDLRGDTLGNPNGTALTNKHDDDTLWAYFRIYPVFGGDGSNTEFLFRMRDSANCNGHLPSVGIYSSYALCTDTLVYPDDDTAGYGMNPFREIADSVKIYNEWIHYTLSDSLHGIFEALAIKISTTYDDTANVDSCAYIVYDLKLNTR